MRESVDVRARRLLIEGRLTLTRVDQTAVLARVRGDSAEVHEVRWQRGEGWECSCTAGLYHRRCAHIAATMLTVVVSKAGA